MKSETSSIRLPSAVQVKLERIRRRDVVLALARTCVIAAAALLAAMTAAMLCDWLWTLFDVRLRIALTTAALVLTAVVVLGQGLPELLAALPLVRAARRADAAVPPLDERWTTVVLLANSSQRPASAAAQAMLQQVASEAAALARLVEPARVSKWTVLRSAGLWLAGSAVACALFLLLDWRQTTVLLQRFWQPWSNISATRLDCLTGDITAPRGDSIELQAVWRGLPRRTATLETVDEVGNVATHRLKVSADDATIRHRLKVIDSFRYRLRAGDGQTSWHRVTAIDYPSLADVQFTIVSPEYANRPVVRKNQLPARVTALQGSRLTLQMRPAAPLQRLELQLSRVNDESGESERSHVLTPDSQGWYSFETPLLEDVLLGPRLWSLHGLADEDRRLCRIQVIPDQAPVARVLATQGEAAVAPDDVLDIRFEAHDDHGIAAAELVVYDETGVENGQSPRVLRVQPIPLGGQQFEKHLAMTVQLDLNELPLEPGSRVSYAVRVTDNRRTLPETVAPSPRDPQTEDADAAVRDDAHRRDASYPMPLAAAGRSSKAPQSADERSASATNPAPTESDSALATSAPSKSDPPADAPAHSAVERRQPPVDAVTAAVAAAAPTPSTGGEAKPLPTSETAANAAPTVANATSPDSLEPVDDDAGRSATPRSSSPANNGTPPPEVVALAPQTSESGQNAETDRRTVRIVERLAAAATAADRRAERTDVRDRVVQIDALLAEAEAGLERLVARELPDADRSEQARRLDERLGDVEAAISALRNDTRDRQFAFVGLQMVDLGRMHITPARERMFVAIREPDAGDDVNSKQALQHVIRAREQLAALLSRYDRAARDQQLAENLQQAAKMYEVYVERSQQLLREALQNRNPLARKMAILELDQEYLDRYAEVLRLRREMMTEFGRLMGDDPRLLARYLEFVKRRRASLRDQLSQLADRQSEIAAELSSWRQAAGEQRDDVWNLLVELRLQSTTPLARDAAELGERVVRQLPLVLESDQGTARRVVETADRIAELARTIALDARQKLQQPNASVDWLQSAERLLELFADLEVALEQLGFEHERDEEVSSYATGRLLESRTVALLADAWRQVVQHLDGKRYSGLAEVDQQALSLATELLRIDMLDMESQLQQSFQQQASADLPAEIANLVRELHTVMESVTFQQSAAAFALSEDRLEAAEAQQTRAVASFERAQELFDRIRRQVASALDEYDVPNPNIADLRDPTLDEFLAQLEREPNIEAQLGLPGRPRNLRVIADSLTWQQSGGAMLGDSEEAALRRAREVMRNRNLEGKPRPQREDNPKDEERREQAEAAEAELAETMMRLRERANDPDTPPAERKRLEQLASELQRRLDERGPDRPADDWNRMTQAARAQELLKALARGEAIPDEQWNRLVSTLDDGLRQTAGLAPPQEYRQAIEHYQERLRKLLGALPEDE